MNSKNSDCILKAFAIVTGTALLLVCLFLYLGDDNMRKWIENCNCVKFILTVVTILVLGGIIVGIWCCKQNCYFSDYRDCLPVYKSGVVVVRENTIDESYTVMHCNTLEAYVAKASDNDTVYVYDFKNTISAELLAKISKKGNIELRFMNTDAKLIIKQKKNNSSQIPQTEKANKQENTTKDEQ